MGEMAGRVAAHFLAPTSAGGHRGAALSLAPRLMTRWSPSKVRNLSKEGNG